ncbi:GNAT family N-acetyltransferase [Verrucomicrobiota bacterium]
MIRPTERFDVSWGDEYEVVSVKEEHKTDIAIFYNKTSAPLYKKDDGGNYEECLYDIGRYFNHHSKLQRYELSLEASTLVYQKQDQQLIALCLISACGENGHIFNIFVDSKHRRKKLATKMIKRAMTILSDTFKNIDLEVETDDPDMSLYEKLGFTRTSDENAIQ